MRSSQPLLTDQRGDCTGSYLMHLPQAGRLAERCLSQCTFSIPPPPPVHASRALSTVIGNSKNSNFQSQVSHSIYQSLLFQELLSCYMLEDNGGAMGKNPRERSVQPGYSSFLSALCTQCPSRVCTQFRTDSAAHGQHLPELDKQGAAFSLNFSQSHTPASWWVQRLRLANLARLGETRLSIAWVIPPTGKNTMTLPATLHFWLIRLTQLPIETRLQITLSPSALLRLP